MLNWSLIDTGGLSLLMPDGLDGAKVAFSTRSGGISRAEMDSLNLALHVGDEESAVIENRRRLMQALGKNLDDMVCCQQVHGKEILKVGVADRGRGAMNYEDAFPHTDAMFTDQPGVVLCTFYADCIPLFFYDPAAGCVGMAHAGWKGAMAAIGPATLQAMKEACGLQADTVQVFIGPGIDACCFAIGEDLADRVQQSLPHQAETLLQRRQKTYWDLKRCHYLQLMEWGVPEENIHISSLCTSCCPDWFYSYRRDQSKTGRMAALIFLECP